MVKATALRVGNTGRASPMLKPLPPPYDPLVWRQLPFAERAQAVCEAWALQGYGSPMAGYLLYAVKLVLYIAAWVGFCALSPELGGFTDIGRWWLEPIAFQKAILWSMLFEGLGLGCGSGPLTGRYSPPIGGVLYFARPGTTKLALYPKLPLLGGSRRSWLDVALYLALVGLLLWQLIAPAIDPRALLAMVVILPLLGLCDRTIFLAFRSEHYWTTLLCFVFAGNWIAGAQGVQLALWFWAGFSKLNHHFPAVVCVMTSNSPFTRMAWLRKRMYRSYPDDLRPSRLAEIMAHAGTVLEMGIPIVLLCSSWEPSLLVVGMVLVLLLHGFITSNVPMGVPIEWNAMVVYGAFALFWAHPDVNVLQLGNPLLGAVLIALLIGVPLLGNLFPQHVSFLLAMRYYAGNWACGVWLFRGECYRKLQQIKTSAGWVYDQLDRFYDRATALGLVGKVMGFRLMHLHGRALPQLLPRALGDTDLRDYEYLDGEIVAGLVLGWNFGDGHLHHERLLELVQEQCKFEPGELRCIFIESQPLGKSTLDYRICDASTGELERGQVQISDLRARQPWAAS